MEPIEDLNKRLVEHYGVDSNTGQPQFRIVWANDQIENRLTEYSETGMKLVTPKVLELPKYYYMMNMYILERLVIVPEEQQKEIGKKISYEPLWGFADDNRNPLPPKWEVCQIVIDTMFAALGKKSLRKYIEDVSPEAKEKEIAAMQQELFGNETETCDALRYKEGIVVPTSYGDAE